MSTYNNIITKLNAGVLLIGFICGLMLVLTGNTLNFLLAKQGINTGLIGLFSLIALPYSINFIWAPILDKWKISIRSIDKRLVWVFLLSVILSIFIWYLALSFQGENLMHVAIFAFICSLISSTQDSVLNGIRSEIHKNQGFASSVYVFGYRFGMLFGSSGAILLSCYISWDIIYKAIAAIILFFPFLLTALIGDFQFTTNSIRNKKNFNIFVFLKKFTIVIIFLILYRLADNVMYVMLNPFLLHLGFGDKEIAMVGKFLGTIGVIIGTVIGGFILNRISITKGLLIFGVLHTISHLFYVFLSVLNTNSLFSLITTVLIESITGGMSMAVYIAFITSLCHGKYRITQYALFSSIMGLSRSLFPSASGILVNMYGWTIFFIISFILSIPALILIKKLPRNH